MHGGKSTGRPPKSGRYTKDARRLEERLGFAMHLMQESHGMDKKNFRFRATPERVERLVTEILKDRNKRRDES